MVIEGSADMTGANRSPTQHTTRGLRCQSVPAPAQAARQGLQEGRLGAGLGLSPSIPDRSKRLELGFPGGAQRVIIATLRDWVVFRLNPNGKNG